MGQADIGEALDSGVRAHRPHRSGRSQLLDQSPRAPDAVSARSMYSGGLASG